MRLWFHLASFAELRFLWYALHEELDTHFRLLLLVQHGVLPLPRRTSLCGVGQQGQASLREVPLVALIGKLCNRRFENWCVLLRLLGVVR